MTELHLDTPYLPMARIQPAQVSLHPPSPNFLHTRSSGSTWKSELKYLSTCQYEHGQNFPTASCFSPSTFIFVLLSGAETGHGQNLNQEGEKLTALAFLSSFFFSTSSIGTVLNYTKIACKALINLTCSNAAFPH